MTDTSDVAIFVIILSARLLVPLAILRYPLPAIMIAFLLDAIDQTIFQQFTDLNLDSYQGYDKALDIYYLTIAYIATLRNWTNSFAFDTSRFLFYYRLVGVVLFELTHWRPILMIFPNTFEYFFDYYEAVRVWWDPRRLSKRHVIVAAAFIWIFIKLPQEYIIHVGQIDTTDWIKTNIFGVSTDASWGEAVTAAPGVTLLILALAALLLVGGWWLITRRAPPPDWSLRFAADPVPATTVGERRQIAMDLGLRRWIENGLIEKVVLLSLVSVIFAQVLPDVRAGNLAIAVGVALLIVVNAAASYWLAARGTGWVATVREFGVMSAFNVALILLYGLLALPAVDGSISIGNTLFFALLLTLIITLFDRYRPVHDGRAATS